MYGVTEDRANITMLFASQFQWNLAVYFTADDTAGQASEGIYQAAGLAHGIKVTVVTHAAVSGVPASVSLDSESYTVQISLQPWISTAWYSLLRFRTHFCCGDTFVRQMSDVIGCISCPYDCPCDLL